MRYVYNLINKSTMETEFKEITCSDVSRITGIPLASIPWIAKDGKFSGKYHIVPVPIARKPKSKLHCEWWTLRDTERWNEAVEPFRRANVQ